MYILIGLFLVCVVVFSLLERYFPRVIPAHRPGPFLRGWFADLTGAVADGPFLFGLTELLVFWAVLNVPFLKNHHGAMSDWPWAAQFAVYFLVTDFWRYWLHRWFHAWGFLWRFHRVHHTAAEMSILSNFRMHLLESIPKYALLVAVFLALGVDRWVLIVYSGIDLLKGCWHHANLRNYIGPLNYVLNSPELHWWHHSPEPRGQLSNFGSTLSLWDWLFGTLYWPRGQWPDRIGVTGIEAFPDDYLNRFLTGFQSDETINRTWKRPANMT